MQICQSPTGRASVFGIAVLFKCSLCHDNIPLEHANLITTTQAEIYAHSFLELSIHLWWLRAPEDIQIVEFNKFFPYSVIELFGGPLCA